MLTTLDVFNQSTLPEEREAHASDLLLPDDKAAPTGGLAAIACCLFFLELALVSLTLGQLLIWCATVATIDPPQMLFSVVDAAFASAAIIHRIPTLIE